MINFSTDPSANPQPMRVTGIVDESRSLFGELQSTALVDASLLRSLGRRSSGRVAVTDHVDQGPARGDARGAGRSRTRCVAPETEVSTSAAESAETLALMTKDAAVFRYLLLVFGAIALLVGSMIIINTFTIIVAQRRRQLGLLRAVGASTAQVRRRLITEATVIGVLGSAGVVSGSGLVLSAAAAAVSGSLADGLRAPAGQIAAAFGAGVLLTWLAALVPARPGHPGSLHWKRSGRSPTPRRRAA